MAAKKKKVLTDNDYEELNKMMLTDDPARAFVLMDEAGLLPYVLPELLAL